MSELKIWYDPQSREVGGSVIEFLQLLREPTCLLVPGRDGSRCRFVVTLLHGNEPSGVMALHRWLSGEREAPAVDTYCVVMNVAAALAEPLFSYRQLPGLRDLNRCFRPPYDDDPGACAGSLLQLIHRVQPEALIDIHNTSGMGPSFGVAVFFDQKHDALVSLFSERLIVTDLRLGALMELSELEVPSVTIECGGAGDAAAHALAYEGLLRFVGERDLFRPRQHDWPIEVLHNPVRLELGKGLRLRYGDAPRADADLCLRVDIEKFNFGEIERDCALGWISGPAFERLTVVDSGGRNLRDDYLRVEAGRLFPATRLKLFMITANPAIALSDCLLYAVRWNQAPAAMPAPSGASG
jgi:hypothetical protein